MKFCVERVVDGRRDRAVLEADEIGKSDEKLIFWRNEGDDTVFVATFPPGTWSGCWKLGEEPPLTPTGVDEGPMGFAPVDMRVNTYRRVLAALCEVGAYSPEVSIGVSVDCIVTVHAHGGALYGKPKEIARILQAVSGEPASVRYASELQSPSGPLSVEYWTTEGGHSVYAYAHHGVSTAEVGRGPGGS